MSTAAQEGTPQEFLPYWNGLAAGSLTFPRCQSCGRFHWYPKKRCPHCLSTELAWQAVAGEGTVYSWTVVRRAFSADHQSRVPYVVALVEFPDAPGVRLVTEVVTAGADPGTGLRCGLPVRPLLADPLSEPDLIRFTPAPE